MEIKKNWLNEIEKLKKCAIIPHGWDFIGSFLFINSLLYVIIIKAYYKKYFTRVWKCGLHYEYGLY